MIFLKQLFIFIGLAGIVYIPLFSYLYCWRFFIKQANSKNRPVIAEKLMLLLLFSTIMLICVAPLFQLFHFMFIAPPLIILAVFTGQHLWKNYFQQGKYSVTKTLAVYFFIIIPLITFIVQFKGVWTKAASIKIPFHTAKGTVLLKSNEDASLLEFIINNTEQGDMIQFYSSPGHPLIYFLTNKKSPIKFSYLSPVYHTAGQFTDAIEILKRNKKVKYIFTTKFDTSKERIKYIWDSIPDSYQNDLAFLSFLKEYYTDIGEVSGLRIFLRRASN